MKTSHQPPLKYSMAQYKSVQRMMAYIVSACAQNMPFYVTAVGKAVARVP
jgi:hypothetical protein